MADLLVDFREANLDGFEPVPPGVYLAVIDSSPAEEVREGRDKGTPYITLRFDIVEPAEHAGKPVFENFMLAGKGAFRLGRLLEVTGLLNREKLSENRTMRLNTWDLHGKKVRIRVGTRQGEDGTVRNTVQAVMSPDTEVPARAAKRIPF